MNCIYMLLLPVLFFNLFQCICHCSLFRTFLVVNRWLYDATRGLSIDCKNPQKARDVSSKKGSSSAVAIESDNVSQDALASSRLSDGENIRSTRLFKQQQQQQLLQQQQKQHDNDDNGGDEDNNGDGAQSHDNSLKHDTVTKR